jgi:hypothetical protein
VENTIVMEMNQALLSTNGNISKHNTESKNLDTKENVLCKLHNVSQKTHKKFFGRS